jgi:hypothetical protein
MIYIQNVEGKKKNGEQKKGIMRYLCEGPIGLEDALRRQSGEDTEDELREDAEVAALLVEWLQLHLHNHLQGELGRILQLVQCHLLGLSKSSRGQVTD